MWKARARARAEARCEGEVPALEPQLSGELVGDWEQEILIVQDADDGPDFGCGGGGSG